MKKIANKIFILCSVLFMASCASTRQNIADMETLTWQYEIEPTTGQATQGAILGKVWSYSKSKTIAQTQAGKNAVHGVLFKGVSALNNNTTRVPAQKAIVTDFNAETIHETYFKEFFTDGGKYMKFVNFVNNGIPAPGDIIRVGKRYKIGVRVSVTKDALRKEMESAGIVKALGAGF